MDWTPATGLGVHGAIISFQKVTNPNHRLPGTGPGAIHVSRAEFYVCRDDREHADLVHGRGKRPGVWQGGVRAGVLWS